VTANPDDSAAEIAAFDICGPLPERMTLLEASAGTGKTFTIAALTARYVAERGVPVERLLVITFTRMATGELRERVRERLVSAHDGLDDVLNGRPSPDDDVIRLLADVERPELEVRRERLAGAIADFDAATIETTHGFCLQVLYGLGTAGDIDREVTLVDDVRDLVDEVVDDLYLRKFLRRANDSGFTRAAAKTIAAKVLDDPDAIVLPPPSEGDELPVIRSRFAYAVRQEMDRRKRARKLLTYDDVLIRLRDTLQDPIRGPVARARLRGRYDVVLVDEFQDTDPVQWEIMHRAFGDAVELGDSTVALVLIGDSKQAIYAFRGADVHAYLGAKELVHDEWTLGVNWRSDAGLLGAFDALFGEAQLGQAGISYRHVEAAPAHLEPRLVGVPVSAPLRARIVHAADGLVRRTRQGQVAAPEARQLIAEDLAGLTVELLDHEPQVIRRRRDGSESDRRTLHPGDIAVLVRSNKQAVTVRDALQAVGVPAVIGGAGSVFLSEAAREYLRLLEALERPTARDRASLVALTQFVGWSATEVAQADEARWEELHLSLHAWTRTLREDGVASLFETVSAARSVPGRVLARPDGERFMTDVRHVTQLLHEAAVSEGVGPNALATWLGRRIAEADRDSENEERTRRLESDAHAVQVITIHRSKGLEFPVVLCPYAWDGYLHPIDVPVFHDTTRSNQRALDVGCQGADLAAHKRLDEAESQGEALRLLYVALTRAEHQAVLWWAGGRDTKNSPLSRLLFARDSEGMVASHGKRTPGDDEVAAALTSFGPALSVERVGPPPPRHWHADTGAAPQLESATFSRRLDAQWRRVSYSRITRPLHDPPAAVRSEPEEPLVSDEDAPTPNWIAADSGDDGVLRLAPLQLGAMPGGTLVGTVMHGVLERVEFDAGDLRGAIVEALGRELEWRNLDLGDTDAVVDGLCAAVESPLGAGVGGLRLRDVSRTRRVDELGFELPLVGGDTPHAPLTVADVADVLQTHLEPDDPLFGYAERLRDPALDGVLRGYLNGSLDLVFALPDGRYVVADYKTNRLAPAGEPLSAWHYRPTALERAMAEAHYPLQALLYVVALHRYLRWRQPGYDPAVHLGGALYLFVRGMSAPEPVWVGDRPCGVWSWQPAPGLVEALSDLFDRGAAA
jgi:exodeoxyribonuclease V beta subunit